MIDFQAGERGVEWKLDFGGESRKLKRHRAAMS
jgi:hypothetical protein